MSLKNGIAKSVLFIALILTMVMLLGVTAFAGDESRAAMISGSIVNLRSGPSTDDEVLGQFVYGDTVYVAADTGSGWVKVKHFDGYGYVYAEYIDYDFNYEVSSEGQAIVNYAKKFIGTPYSYGGRSPSGFDCSGLTSYVYSHFGYSVNRVASSQMSNGTAVSKSNLMPGDLVGFYTSSSSTVTHVGIYVGDGYFIHSPSPGKSVCLTPLNSSYYGPRYSGARRIV